MSVTSIILSLIDGIEDPADRIEIARTINLIYQAFSKGQATEEEVRKDLLDIVKTVLRIKNPLLPKEEINQRANEIVENLLLAFKPRRFGRHTFRKYVSF